MSIRTLKQSGLPGWRPLLLLVCLVVLLLLSRERVGSLLLVAAMSLSAAVPLLVLRSQEFDGLVSALLGMAVTSLAFLWLHPGFLPLYSSFFSPPGLAIHLWLSSIAVGHLSLATGISVLLIVQGRSVKRLKPGLPGLSIEGLEKAQVSFIWSGIFLLSSAILSGMIFVEVLRPEWLRSKAVFSLFGWLLLAMLLWARYIRGLRGRALLIWTLSATAVISLIFYATLYLL